jgi:subtilisin family serine protease
LIQTPVIKNKNHYFLEGWRLISVKGKARAEELVCLLKEQKGVKEAFVELPLRVKPSISPNDPYFVNGSQWHLKSISNPLADIDAEAAWDINRGRNDVIIAVADGGVDYNHPDLDPGNRSRVIAGYDFGDFDSDPMDDLPDNNPLSYADHGTKVAGAIGALTNDSAGVAGIMWNCKIMPLKMVSSFTISYPFIGTIFDFSTTALPSSTAMAIDYAVSHGAHVINMSYGISGLGYTLAVVPQQLSVLYDAIANAY